MSEKMNPLNYLNQIKQAYLTIYFDMQQLIARPKSMKLILRLFFLFLFVASTTHKNNSFMCYEMNSSFHPFRYHMVAHLN
ncbi:CLUMA_CG002737, isoform A [Clunio marinus]|uniref:CLUMA_CG002737, isoform A n=1 Tax=Clunio marinus TaxID=568069 RepID=A0A1J1HRU1_9DIPT|nr:CLUMA_CG002737, isoform A [Clunio marinus]